MANCFSEFRDKLMTALVKSIDPDNVKAVLSVIDTVSAEYEITKKELALSVITDIPEEVKYYLVAKTIENSSKQTIKQYKHKLINFFHAVRKSVQDVTTTDVRIYLYNYKQQNNNSDSSVDSTRRVLNAFYQWAVKNEYVLRNPVLKIEHIKFQSKERQPLSQINLESLRYCCHNVREKALVDFLYSTGCRVSECSNVLLSDIDWNARSVVIKHGKGDKRRTVFFNAESELSLKNYLRTREDDTPYLFVSDRKPHNQLGVKSIQNIFRNISERSNIKVTPHILRHTFATNGLRAGIPIDRLQAMMGHTRPETTLIYAKLDKSELQMEHQRAFG